MNTCGLEKFLFVHRAPQRFYQLNPSDFVQFCLNPEHTLGHRPPAPTDRCSLILVWHMTPLRVAMIVFLAASIQAQPLDAPPSAAQLREWIDDKCVSSESTWASTTQVRLSARFAESPLGSQSYFATQSAVI